MTALKAIAASLRSLESRLDTGLTPETQTTVAILAPYQFSQTAGLRDAIRTLKTHGLADAAAAAQRHLDDAVDPLAWNPRSADDAERLSAFALGRLYVFGELARQNDYSASATAAAVDQYQNFPPLLRQALVSSLMSLGAGRSA
ncbi:MAG: hypothetical protein AAFX94_11560 [Myxococcota bacterium]